MWLSRIPFQRTQWGEEPPVLAALVSLLKRLLDVLLGVLSLGNLLEGVVGDSTLQTLELKGVAGWHDVVVVDDLDEWLDLGALLLAGLGHATGDLLGVALNAGNDGVREWVSLGALVDWLDDHDLKISASGLRSLIMPRFSLSFPSPFHATAYLLAGVAATADDGDTANLEDCSRIR